MPYTFGEKVKLVGELAADDRVFAKPARIRELLSQLESLVRLRADLAHATLVSSIESDSGIYAFELPNARNGSHFTGRFWLTSSELPTLIGALKKSRKE